MVQTAAPGKQDNSIHKSNLGQADPAATRRFGEAGPLGSAIWNGQVWKKQQRTRLKQVGWGKKDNGVMAGAHMASLWVIQKYTWRECLSNIG